MVSVSNVNSVKNSVYNKSNADDVKKLVKYVNGETLTAQADTFTSTVKGSVPMVGLFEGIPLVNLLKRNKKLSGSVVNDAMKNLQATNKESVVKLLKGEKKLAEYIADAEKSKEAYSAIKSATKKEFQEKGLSKLYNAKQALKASKPAQAVKAVKDTAGKKISKLVEKYVSKSTEKVAEEAIEKTITKTAAETAKVAVKPASKLSKVFKSSGAGLMLAISGFVELMTEVLPTYKQLGTEKGTKQAVKSAVRVVGDTAGFIGGGYVGTAIGAAVGSVVPVVGTAIGGALGFVGGLVGSFVMGKITRKITGKTELEKFKEAQQQAQVNSFQYDEAALKELKELAVQKIEQEYEQTGNLSKDSVIALDAFKNLNELNVFA